MGGRGGRRKRGCRGKSVEGRGYESSHLNADVWTDRANSRAASNW